MDAIFPQEGNAAFRDGGRACLMTTRWHVASEFSQVASGYKQASDILVDHLARHGRNDGLVWPILFGYRQYVELAIKALWKIVNRFDEVDEDLKLKHDLSLFWNQIRARLLEELEDDDREAFEAAESVIMEFHERDRTSVCFRFPSNIEQCNIDIVNMRDVMGRVATFLDSLLDVWHEAARGKS